MENIYYLFGTEAIHSFKKGGIELVLTDSEKYNIDFGYFAFTEGETKSIQLLKYSSRWMDFEVINKEDFEKLNLKYSKDLEILFAKANYLHSNYIGNEGKLSYPDKQYGYLCDEIEDVEVGYFKFDYVDSDYSNRLRDEDFSINAKEACNILSHRIEEIEEYYQETGTPLFYNIAFAPEYINQDVEEAKRVLKENGYFVENLWHIDDVKSKYECTNEEAQTVLNDVLSGEWFIGEVNASIDISADAYCLEKIKSKYFIVSGFWKDTNENFENYIIKEFEDVDEDEDEDKEIFFYGLNASDIEELIIEKWNSEHEFVITSYEEIKN